MRSNLGHGGGTGAPVSLVADSLAALAAILDSGDLDATKASRTVIEGARLAMQGLVATATTHLRYDGYVTETGTLTAFGYARVSTSEQARTGYGLAAQRRAVTREVEHHDWHLAELILDEGESGKDLDRPGVRDVLQRLADGEADALVVHKLDRLTRSVLDLAELLAWSVHVGVRLVFIDLGIDTGTPNGRLVATIMAGVAEWEREQISARTLDAASERRAQGKRMGRAGVRDTRPELAERIRTERESGATWQTIADRLNADEEPTVRGGTHWRVSSVQSAAGYVRPTEKARRITLPEPKKGRKTPTPARIEVTK